MQKIGDVLSYADELIQNTCRIIEQTRRLKKGLMRRLFTKGIGHTKFKQVSFGGQVTEDIPDSWQLCSVEELSKGGTQNGIAISIDDYGKGTPIVGMTNLFSNDVLNYVGLKEVRNMKGMDKFYLKNGDLLFGRRSMNVAGAGKCVYVSEVPHPIVFESSIIRMSPNLEKVIPKFLFYLLYSQIGRRIMTRIVQVVAVSGC